MTATQYEHFHGGNRFLSVINDGTPAKIFLMDPAEGDLPVGWVLIWTEDSSLLTDEPVGCVIGHIQVREQYRRRGYGRKLIKMLQGNYPRIVTDVETAIMNSASTLLLLECGFRHIPKIFRRACGKLISRKEKA